MVWAVVENSKGEKEDFRKPCFGFMSYINQWDETDEWDDDEGDWIYECISGFQPGELKLMRFMPETHRHLGNDETEKSWYSDYMPKVLEAMEVLPQYYEGVKYIPRNAEEDGEEQFVWDLQNANMQTTIIGAMMLRNVLQYPSMRSVFRICIDAGISPVISFIMGNSYSRGYSTSFGSSTGQYLSNPVHYGDESIFSDEVRVCDLKAFVEGKLGLIYQGVWGDTENGYGRYGEYDGDEAERFARCDRAATITDTLLLIEGYEDSKRMHNLEHEVCSSHRFNDEELVELAQKIAEAIK